MTEPIVLAFDTATEYCSVALLDSRCIEKTEHLGQGHSERILPMVDEVLGEAGLDLREVDLIAFGAGPGSFTGLRIACGVAQGLAWGVAKRVVAIGNLRALAARALAVESRGEVVLAAIDARMNESYCAAYKRSAEVAELRAAALVAPADLPALVAELGASIVVGNALTAFPEFWQDGVSARLLPQLRAGAAEIARLARIDARLGRTVAPHEATPLYVRDQVALTIAERHAKVAST